MSEGHSELRISIPALSDSGKLWIAYSGGLDSTVLLHWVIRHTSLRPCAVHIHHGLQSDADAWAEHCRAFCQQQDIEFLQKEVSVVGAAEKGVEAAAREARYAALSECLSANDVLLTAHHQDDQAETLLLQLLRGAGPHGLSGMPAESACGNGRLLRPMLGISREQLRQYALSHDLAWVEDPSNEETRYRRNYLRQRVLPVLETAWPGGREVLARGAGLQAEAARLMDDLAAGDIQAVELAGSDCLSISKLLRLPEHRCRNVLRYWLKRVGLAVPNQAQMRRIQKDVLDCRTDANPVVNWADVELRRYRDALFAMRSMPPPPDAQSLHWNLQTPLVLPDGCGELIAERAQGAGLHLESPELEVRFGQEGEQIQAAFSSHHKRLKHLYQENAVPPWVRKRLPLIYHKQCLAAVADRWIAADYAAQRSEQGWRIHWRGSPVGWQAQAISSEATQ